ncbi:MAG: homocysteine S-methyltransferase family protein [Candidatus Tritonobacter lacicola]|nr:homocysteine S-methyltransferase family protein [Candidatus Tritonobacter lacicola]
MSAILDRLRERVLIYDGAMGTVLQELGLKPGECPETLNLVNPGLVGDAHARNIEAGADVIQTNTFGASRFKLASCGLGADVEKVNAEGVRIAKRASAGRVFVGASMGPLGVLVEPIGELSFQAAIDAFKEQAGPLVEAGADFIIIETITDVREAKAAILAVREISSDIPVQVSMTFEEGAKTVFGTTPSAAAVILQAAGADIVGANCGTGPEKLFDVIREMALFTDLPIVVQPNAGIPELVDGRTVFNASPRFMARCAIKYVYLGVNGVGGCCGTKPEHIKAVADKIKGVAPTYREFKPALRLASRTRVVGFGLDRFVMVGERINPTRKKVLAGEIEAGKYVAVRREAVEQVAAGAAVLDVNVGIPGDEAEFMRRAVAAVETAVDVPLAIDSADVGVLEAGLIACGGKPLLNSTTGEEGRIEAVLGLARRYGAAVLCLLMDGKGIPASAEDKIAIAARIISRAREMGFDERELIFDPIAMSAAADPGSVRETLRALVILKDMGRLTTLGISNVSFGLPQRSLLNSSFLAMAMGRGLDAAIVNPMSDRIKSAVSSCDLLLGRRSDLLSLEPPPPGAQPGDIGSRLYQAMLTGDREHILGLIDEALAGGEDPLRMNLDIFIPALDEVGRKYESKEYFLPQLMLAAETMQLAFNHLKEKIGSTRGEGKGRIVMATVKGDVHDIGKNIVAAVLRGYGYEVIDMGSSVPSGDIIGKAKEIKPDIVGLSALMTTTLPEMEKVVKLLGEAGTGARTMVGGAVVTQKYADSIGADGYGKDAISAVKVADRLVKHKKQR